MAGAQQVTWGRGGVVGGRAGATSWKLCRQGGRKGLSFVPSTRVFQKTECRSRKVEAVRPEQGCTVLRW